MVHPTTNQLCTKYAQKTSYVQHLTNSSCFLGANRHNAPSRVIGKKPKQITLTLLLVIKQVIAYEIINLYPTLRNSSIKTNSKPTHELVITIVNSGSFRFEFHMYIHAYSEN